MKFTLFEQMGLGNIDFSFIFIAMSVIIIVMLILLIIQMTKLNKLNKTYKKFMSGKNVKSLESEIMNLFEENTEMKEQINTNRRDIRSIYKQMRKVYQKSSIIRYDAFKEMGGKLSFCLAMLDEENNGFILNSVHSSAGCYSYLKEIKGGRCSIDLGAEEQKALDDALGGNNEIN